MAPKSKGDALRQSPVGTQHRVMLVTGPVPSLPEPSAERELSKPWSESPREPKRSKVVPAVAAEDGGATGPSVPRRGAIRSSGWYGCNVSVSIFVVLVRPEAGHLQVKGERRTDTRTHTERTETSLNCH